MVLPQKFPVPPSAIASYDWIDIANGLGYEVYYGFNANETLGVTNSSSVYAGTIHKNGVAIMVADDNAYDEMYDLDFDITFNLPRNVKGKIFIQIPFGCNILATGTETLTMKATADVYHYDGSSETPMGSTATTEEIYSSAPAQHSSVSYISTIIVNQTTAKHFKKGDTLRITIKGFIKHASSQNKSILAGIGTDPLNRSDKLHPFPGSVDKEKQVIATNGPTQVAFFIPFVVDV